MKYTHLTCALLRSFALSFALSALTLSAQVVTPTLETTGMIGIADAQTAQFNLLNPGILPPAVGVVCSVVASFVDNTGLVIKSMPLTILPGQSMSVSIRSDTDLNLLPGDRREIRATISTISTCKLIPTLEILDTSSGRTLVTLGHVEAVPAGPVTP
jgi:hypothetical protein